MRWRAVWLPLSWRALARKQFLAENRAKALHQRDISRFVYTLGAWEIMVWSNLSTKDVSRTSRDNTKPPGYSPVNTQQQNLSAAWDEAAAGYEAYFVPRFWPWNLAALQELLSRPLPPGALLVPCCGPGHELEALAKHFPEREIVGVDLSAEMAARASLRAGPRGRAEAGDASDLSRYQGAAAVLSCFGLQQMPDPPAALAHWASLLAPGGILSVIYWPPDSDQGGPFSRVRSVLVARGMRSPSEWEGALIPALKATGAAILADRALSFVMEHESGEAFWDALAFAGPMRSLSRQVSAEVLASLRDEFLSSFPRGPVAHPATARLLVATR